MTTPVVGALVDFLADLFTLFDFLMGSSGETGTIVSLGEAGFLNFHAFLGGVAPVAYLRKVLHESQSVYQIVISRGMHANVVSLGDCIVFSKEVVNDNFGESTLLETRKVSVTSKVVIVLARS
ncbi:hypothetical protein Tco_0998107 [Tanacetum coccineum]